MHDYQIPSSRPLMFVQEVLDAMNKEYKRNNPLRINFLTLAVHMLEKVKVTYGFISSSINNEVVLANEENPVATNTIAWEKGEDEELDALIDLSEWDISDNFHINQKEYEAACVMLGIMAENIIRIRYEEYKGKNPEYKVGLFYSAGSSFYTLMMKHLKVTPQNQFTDVDCLNFIVDAYNFIKNIEDDETFFRYLQWKSRDELIKKFEDAILILLNEEKMAAKINELIYETPNAKKTKLNLEEVIRKYDSLVEKRTEEAKEQKKEYIPNPARMRAKNILHAVNVTCKDPAVTPETAIEDAHYMQVRKGGMIFAGQLVWQSLYTRYQPSELLDFLCFGLNIEGFQSADIISRKNFLEALSNHIKDIKEAAKESSFLADKKKEIDLLVECLPEVENLLADDLLRYKKSQSTLTETCLRKGASTAVYEGSTLAITKFVKDLLVGAVGGVVTITGMATPAGVAAAVVYEVVSIVLMTKVGEYLYNSIIPSGVAKITKTAMNDMSDLVGNLAVDAAGLVYKGTVQPVYYVLRRLLGMCQEYNIDNPEIDKLKFKLNLLILPDHLFAKEKKERIEQMSGLVEECRMQILERQEVAIKP